MEPTALLVAAIAAGATAAGKDDSAAAVKDAYDTLRALVIRKLGNQRTTRQRCGGGRGRSARGSIGSG